MTDERRFSRSPTSASAARRFARAALRGLADEIVDAAVLMVSELATNAIEHAESEFVVRLTRDAAEVRIEVDDDGPGRPRVLAPGLADSSGRGVQIVEAMSRSWGVRSKPPGKTVWFTLSTTATPGHSGDGAAEGRVTESSAAGRERSGAQRAARSSRQSRPGRGGNRPKASRRPRRGPSQAAIVRSSNSKSASKCRSAAASS
jgi:anti-sigma regulatory factor (Ser/Thr protein kinase)